MLQLSLKRKMNIVLGALLHDIGKYKIDKKILNKPNSLTAEEYEIIKAHTDINIRLIKNEVIKNIIKYHHENIDGTGYYYLINENIPYEAKIVRAADVFIALIEKRTYKQKLSKIQAIKIMTEESEYYDNVIFSKLKEIVEKKEQVKNKVILKKYINEKE